MEIIWVPLSIIGASIWLGILLLPWRPWSTHESLDAVPTPSTEDLSSITALIPARNEAETIGSALRGLKAQGNGLNIVLVDDRSTDATGEMARNADVEGLHIVSGKPLPDGWSGKLWALEQGRAFIKTPLTLLMDADIELQPGILVTLKKMKEENELHLVSLMAALRMENGWERLLMPAFIYFFKLLYPFRLSNSPSSRVAATAGGFILLETHLLEEMGGFQVLRGELIDDCALARRIKAMGCKTWIGLTHSVRSLRRYNDLKTIWNMVARTAFTQLQYSKLLLTLCTAVLLAAFLVPVVSLALGSPLAGLVAAIALVAMILGFLPTLRFYRLSGWWAMSLPLTGLLYLGMTWTSAIRHRQGKGARWKNRTYHSNGIEG